VVASEIGESSDIEAIKAQSVAARSYVVAALVAGATQVEDNTNFQAFAYFDNAKIPQCIQPIKRGVEFVGYIIYPTYRKLRKQTVKHIKRSLKSVVRKYTAGEKTRADTMSTIKSYFGLAKHCASLTWRKWISKNIIIVRRPQNEPILLDRKT
jgi:translation elongation factor EF-Ts